MKLLSISNIQRLSVVLLFALLGAKIPSLIEQDNSISPWAGLAGAAIAASAILIESFFSERVREVEEARSSGQLFVLSVATISFIIAVTCFTAYLYTEFDFLKVVLAISILTGAVATFSGVVMAWIK